jgi:hypothetical protein
MMYILAEHVHNQHIFKLTQSNQYSEELLFKDSDKRAKKNFVTAKIFSRHFERVTGFSMEHH